MSARQGFRKPDAGVLIALIAKALSERFPSDSIAPGVIVAHLPNDGAQDCPIFYVSAGRYPQSSSIREVVAKVYDEDLDIALLLLARIVCDSGEHRDELRNELREVVP